MGVNNLTLDSVNGALLAAFPEFEERIRNAFGSDFDLATGTPDETPGAYLVFEDVVKKLVVELLVSGEDEKLLKRLFLFFESMAMSTDTDVSRDLLGIAILEPLVYEKACIRAAWRFMGPKMKEFSVLEASHQGREDHLPPVL
jgi:hypothetical protein